MSFQSNFNFFALCEQSIQTKEQKEKMKNVMISMIRIISEGEKNTQNFESILLNCDLFVLQSVYIYWFRSFQKCLSVIEETKFRFQSIIQQSIKKEKEKKSSSFCFSFLEAELTWKKSLRFIALECLNNICQMNLKKKSISLKESSDFPHFILRDSQFVNWSPWFLVHQVYFFFHQKNRRGLVDCFFKLIFLHKLIHFPEWLSGSRSNRKQYLRAKGRKTAQTAYSSSQNSYALLGPIQSSSHSLSLIRFLQGFPVCVNHLFYLYYSTIDFLGTGTEQEEEEEEENLRIEACLNKLARFHQKRTKTKSP